MSTTDLQICHPLLLSKQHVHNCKCHSSHGQCYLMRRSTAILHAVFYIVSCSCLWTPLESSWWIEESNILRIHNKHNTAEDEQGQSRKTLQSATLHQFWLPLMTPKTLVVLLSTVSCSIYRCHVCSTGSTCSWSGPWQLILSCPILSHPIRLLLI